MQPQGFKEVISASSGSSRPASEHTLRAGTCCSSAAMPGSEPSHEVSGVIFPPGLESNKDSLLLRKCWGWEVPCPLDLAKRKSKLQVIWPKPADAAQKSHSGCCETGKSQSKYSPRKHKQSCLVLERLGGEDRSEGPSDFQEAPTLGLSFSAGSPDATNT